ncbi:hypothetical protein [Enterobacter sp. KB-221C9]|uniref:hypothetical protein n=1 Tax=Enterobacter sp. KB-221C9 TaxID=3242496 RepID=UPI00351FC6C1
MNFIDKQHFITLLASIAGLLFSKYVSPELWTYTKLYFIQIWGVGEVNRLYTLSMKERLNNNKGDTRRLYYSRTLLDFSDVTHLL